MQKSGTNEITMEKFGCGGCEHYSQEYDHDEAITRPYCMKEERFIPTDIVQWGDIPGWCYQWGSNLEFDFNSICPFHGKKILSVKGNWNCLKCIEVGK